MGLVLLTSSAAHAQGGVPLVTVATDQSSLNLSNQFGVPAGTAINQAGDFAFVGNGNTALFLRAAGAPAATRLLQIEDEVPGFPGSQILSFLPELGINSSRMLFFGVSFKGADNEPHSALLTYDGTNYHTVVSSGDIAPGSGGATYGFDLVPGSINDNGDVNFAAVVGSTTFYIVPVGKPAVRIVGLGDTPPTACTWCGTSGSLGGFFAGTPSGAIIFGNSFVPGLNSQGQMLLEIWGGLFIGSKDGTLSLVPMASTGACSPQPITTGTSSLAAPGISGFLNDNGAVAFTNPSSSGSAAICVAPTGGGSPSAAITAADLAPASVGGTMTSPVALGLDDSGDIVFQSPISGASITTFALLRYHQSNAPTDVVAYNCEQAPGTNGSVFSPFPPSIPWGPGVICPTLESAFRGVSMAIDGRVSFNASLSSGGSGIYRQTGAATAPEFISLDSSGVPTLPFGVNVSVFSFTIFSTTGQTKILNNGSVFFSSYLTSGAADFAVYLGTPGNVQSLMSTSDLLPSGARTILGSTPPRAAGHFVAFTAQPAAGRINLLESDLTTGAITRVVSDNDPGFATAGGTPGNTVLAPNYFLNESGEVAFETTGANVLSGFRSVIGFGGSGTVNSAWLSSPIPNCGTIFLWSPSGGLTKVAAAGDAVPNSTVKFSCVSLNSGPPSPLNQSGQLAFTSPSPFGPPLPCFLCGGFINPAIGVNGVFLYTPGGTISEIAAANDTLPGQGQPTSFVPNLPVPVNSQGQVAFGAQLGTTSQGFFLRNAGATEKVVENGDTIPGSSATFGFPHFIAGLTDSGNLAFTAATSAAADGLFLAPTGGAIQTLALDGGAAPVPGGGTFSLTPGALVASTNPTSVTLSAGINLLKNYAVINGESDVAFSANIESGSTNSGYFRVLQSGPAAGVPQAVVLQGQAAPGGGTFTAIPFASTPAILIAGMQDPDFALGPDGALAFVNEFTSDPGGILAEGMFVARPDGTLVKVAATGDVLPLPGGGVLAGLSMSPKLAAGDPGKFAFAAAIVGGAARRAVFVTAIPASTTTTLSPLQSPAVAQQPVTLTATVTCTTAGAGTPTGTVTFFDNGVSLETKTLDPSGQATLTTSSLAAGQDSIVAQYGGDTNFAPGNSTPLAVVVAGFAPPPANLTVTPGQSLVIPLTVFAPAGSTMSFSLSCSGLPANTACMFDMNPVAPGPTGTTVHLTLTTKASSKLLPLEPRKGPPAFGGFGLITLLAALFATATLVWRQAPRWRLVPCACLATFALALAIGGCGASSYSSSAPVTPGTPAGNASFTVTGTSGAATISAVVNVTVK
jgi:hypothetical protein